jgi:hypothetical protein
MPLKNGGIVLATHRNLQFQCNITTINCSDIAFNIMMTESKVKKLRRRLDALCRKRSVTIGELQSFAKDMGRRKLTGAKSRGKEPQWVSDEFPELRPISIPFHGRKTNALPTGTGKSILNDFDGDVCKLELKYNERDENKEEDCIEE